VFGSAGADATLAGVALRMSHEAAVFQIGTFVAQSKGCVAITAPRNDKIKNKQTKIVIQFPIIFRSQILKIDFMQSNIKRN
jgi:hypothetical protein